MIHSLALCSDQIFDTMRRYNLGIEEATRTIIVGRALRRAMETATPAEAIESLASKIAPRNLVYDSSSDADSASMDDESVAMHANLRVEPVSTIDRQLSSRKSPPIRKMKSVGKAMRARKTPTKLAASGRKRSIDEMASHDKSDTQGFSNRQRADSVSKEVSAKIALQTYVDESGSPIENAVRPAPGVRAKRGLRADDSDALNSNSSKRIRGSEE